MTLLDIYLEEISPAPWRATKYSFTALVTTNRTEVSMFLRKIMNTAPPLTPPIFGAALPPLVTWKKVSSGLNLPRFNSVEGSSHLFFDRFIDQLIH